MGAVYIHTQTNLLHKTRKVFAIILKGLPIYFQFYLLLLILCIDVVFVQLRSTYERKCRDADRSVEQLHKLETNPLTKPKDLTTVSEPLLFAI